MNLWTLLVVPLVDALRREGKGIKQFSLLCEVELLDGKKHEVVLTLLGEEIAKELVKLDTSKSVVKEALKSVEKPKGKGNYQLPKFMGLCRCLGVVSYLTNAGNWMDCGIVDIVDGDTLELGGIKDGKVKINFTWTVSKSERLKNRRAVKKGECKCEKCMVPVKKAA